MDYPFQLPGHPNLNLSLRTGGFFSGVQILKDGVPLKRAKASIPVPLADGSTLELKIKTGFDMFTPKVHFAGQDIEVMPPLPALWVVWAYLPLVLIFVGGLLGGLCGGLAAGGTISVLRSELPPWARITIGLFLPPLGILAYCVAVFVLLQARQ
ncbi:hypothetical protein [Prosthecobacter sp.]|uniref:hypothetical protein n=1 Tax=Prosthecobacter sp. TaxID=1965333 RepID=UPI00378323FD